MTVLPSLMVDTTDVHRMHKRNKVSNHELRLAEFIV
uniref:Uncharacterized protein n=1 Tax=Plectus sambesii TaxID=2011161 RepID=A0A914VIA3_9BILA